MKIKENRIVVADAGWYESAPEWLKEEVKTERLMHGMVGLLKDKNQEVGDAEACLYLYTASLKAPMSDRLANVYIYLCAKLVKRHSSGLTDFMKEKLQQGLTPDEARELRELKEELFKKRGGNVSSPLLDMLKEVKKHEIPRHKNI